MPKRILDIEDVLGQDNIEVTPIVLVPSNGKVKKKHIRDALNMRHRDVMVNDIKALCKSNGQFKLLYEPYRESWYMTIKLAVYYINHLYPDRKVVVSKTNKG